MFDNIRAHSRVVARVALELADGLAAGSKQDMPFDRQLVIVGALLHDIAKTLCLGTGCRHAEAGEKIMIELGYPAIGEIVGEHVFLKEFRDDRYRQGKFIAKEIVYYADKRVRHDQVVSLADRLEYIIERYGNRDPHREQLIRLNFQKTLELEKYMFAHLDFSPESLVDRLANCQFFTA